jgi:hypothetical protein
MTIQRLASIKRKYARSYHILSGFTIKGTKFVSTIRVSSRLMMEQIT